ncbi:MAG: D-tyrosyl-tRNA(Tyr) deacylase [Burkholderiales bacterium]|nr:D-tyrosyl-tRNA(Tyr) deacylase [Phycisphaerae bacterium]
MIAVVQRVRSASVTVDAQIVGRIDLGLCVLASIVRDDSESDLIWMAEKLTTLRIFPSGADKAFDLDVRQIGGAMLLISNFTVAAATRRGRRPSFDSAMPPAQALEMFDRFVAIARATGIPTGTGRFGADMIVNIENDGPATFVVDSRARE